MPILWWKDDFQHFHIKNERAVSCLKRPHGWACMHASTLYVVRFEGCHHLPCNNSPTFVP